MSLCTDLPDSIIYEPLEIQVKDFYSSDPRARVLSFIIIFSQLMNKQNSGIQVGTQQDVRLYSDHRYQPQIKRVQKKAFRA